MEKVKTQRVRWIELNGKQVLLADFSHGTVKDSLDLIGLFNDVMEAQAPGSVLLLTDVTGSEYDPSIARQWKEARLNHDDKFRASAIYGLSGLVGIAIRGFIEVRRLLGLSEANMPRIFADSEAAREWLGKQ